jgi:hypothetical protein
MGLHHKIKTWRSLDRRHIKKNTSPKNIKSRRINPGLERKKSTSPHVKDKQPEYIATSKRNVAYDESAKHHGIFDWLVRNRIESVQEATVATSNAGGDGNVDESTNVVHTTGPAWMCNCTADKSESEGEDSRTRIAAQEAAPDAGTDGNAPESGFYTLVTGWERVLCCMGWGSSHQLVDQTCENSKNWGESSSRRSDGSYDDDEASGESSQPDVSRVDQVLTLSAIADDMSDISLSDSDDDDSDNDSQYSKR